jgi:F420-non-reducing hydrogenase small subunit
MNPKPKLAMFWASSCGGCEVAVLNLNEHFLSMDAYFEFVFCPCLLDTKRSELEAMPDRSIAITFFNGAIRTEENFEMARLLRAKSEVLIAFGSCSSEGCIPALSNLYTKDQHFHSIYRSNPTIDNPTGTLPQLKTLLPEGELELPRFFDHVLPLREAVDVDYFIPGCPPESHQIWNIVETVIQRKALPPKRSVLGAGNSSVCGECSRLRENKRIPLFYRTYEIIPDTTRCLLDQGILCLGIATRDGCGALCPQVNMPCTGCYGPPEGIRDQGAKMIAALGSILNIGSYSALNEEDLNSKADSLIDRIPDIAGNFYKYSLAGSLLGGKVR